MNESADARPAGMGGWLRLVELGLIVSPLLTIYSLYAVHWPIFRDGAWNVLTTPGTEQYHPLWAPLIAFEIVGNLALAILSVIALLHFTRRSRHAPRLCIALLLCGVLLPLSLYYFAKLIPAAVTEGSSGPLVEVLRSLVPAAIWIPYFLLSKRVRSTFVR